jgi:hypothetical protein
MRERANARARERWDSRVRTLRIAPSPRVDRSIDRIDRIDRIHRIRPLRDPHTDARDRDAPARDVAPRDARALARRFGARAERRSTARAGDDARDDGEARVARRATGTRDRDAAETTGGDPGGRARDAGAEDREARTTGDGWAGVRDVRGGEDVEMAKDG